MRRYWIGFLLGAVLHWLIVFLPCFVGEGKILVPALSRNFQYTFLLITTILWGVLGGAIFTLWTYSREMKAKGLTRRYLASLGFLIGALGAALLSVLPNLPELPGWLKPLDKVLTFAVGVYYIPFFIFFFFLNALEELFFYRFLPSRNFLTKGFFYDPQVPESKFVGYSLLTLLVLVFLWATIGSALGYLLGLLKEKLFLKRSGNDDEKG